MPFSLSDRVLSRAPDDAFAGQLTLSAGTPSEPLVETSNSNERSPIVRIFIGVAVQHTQLRSPKRLCRSNIVSLSLPVKFKHKVCCRLRVDRPQAGHNGGRPQHHEGAHQAYDAFAPVG